MSRHCILILGSGPAGLTAAIYCGRACLDTFVIAGVEAGGQLMTTNEVENYPGAPDVTGPQLMDNMRLQAERFGAKFVHHNVSEVDFSGFPLKVKADDQWYEGAAVIVATGAAPRWLGLDSEQRLRGRGVSSCATCDGAFFRNRDVAVVGGGDAAVEEAMLLSQICSHVTLIHRRDTLRAQQVLQQRLFESPDIDIAWNSQVLEILGDQAVEGVRVKDTTDGSERDIPCKGVFVSIGHKPNTDFLKGHLALDEKGYAVKKDETRTEVDGVFVAGDVYDFWYRQAVTAAGSGCKAALDAIRYTERVRCEECRSRCAKEEQE